MSQCLNFEEISRARNRTPAWALGEKTILRTFRFKDFAEALAFVNRVGALGEAADHHPDIDIRWNKVALALSTHSAGGLTDKDFALAEQIDAI